MPLKSYQLSNPQKQALSVEDTGSGVTLNSRSPPSRSIRKNRHDEAQDFHATFLHNPASPISRDIPTEDVKLMDDFRALYDVPAFNLSCSEDDSKRLCGTCELQISHEALEENKSLDAALKNLDLNDDDDWEKIEAEDFSENAQKGLFIPSVVYQSATFRATIQEFLDRYQLSEEQKQALKGAWLVIKWAGEFGYAIVSEPILDAAHWTVQRQFGCDLDELPGALRIRLVASLPENMKKALQYTSKKVLRGGGFVLDPSTVRAPLTATSASDTPKTDDANDSTTLRSGGTDSLIVRNWDDSDQGSKQYGKKSG